MYGGFSKWMKGEDPSGKDSVALPVVDGLLLVVVVVVVIVVVMVVIVVVMVVFGISAHNIHNSNPKKKIIIITLFSPPENHWKEMRVLILVANDQKKAVGSTEGMQKSLEGVAGMWEKEGGGEGEGIWKNFVCFFIYLFVYLLVVYR